MSAPVAAAVAACAVLLGIPVLAGTVAVSADAQAAAAADAASLAGADALLGWASVEAAPCELAAQAADANGTRLVACLVDDRKAEVRVRVTTRAGVFRVTREARAGPAVDAE